MDNKCVEKLLETVAFSNGCICSVELIRWEHTHFHPSGSTDPSEGDFALVRRIYDSGRLMCVPLIDNIIIGEDGAYFSFREEHMMPNQKTH